MQSDVFVYLPDQSSPLTLQGKRECDQDFLMALQNEPLSNKRPENLLDLDDGLKDKNNLVSVTGSIMR
jgi:hypothetical protein